MNRPSRILGVRSQPPHLLNTAVSQPGLHRTGLSRLSDFRFLVQGFRFLGFRVLASASVKIQGFKLMASGFGGLGPAAHAGDGDGRAEGEHAVVR